MRLRTVIWLVSIIVVGSVLIGASQCGYEKLRSMTSLESKSVKIEKEFPDVEHISTSTLATLIEADEKGAVPILVVDCRGADEFAVSRIPSAVHLESADAVAVFLKKTDPKPNTIAVYCSVGQRSATVVHALNKAGIKNAKNVSGSIFAWANEDRALVGADGKPADKVHPFNEYWGRLVKKERRFENVSTSQ